VIACALVLVSIRTRTTIEPAVTLSTASVSRALSESSCASAARKASCSRVPKSFAVAASSKVAVIL
jgi:hypothetical protein